MRLLFTSSVIATLLMAPAAAFAQTGYQCYQWNNRGECTDFSYIEGGTTMHSAPYYNDPYASRGSTAGRVVVRATGTPNPVVRGSILTYNIYVRNEDNVSRSITVRAFMDADESFVDAVGGLSDGRNVRWELTLGARSSRTLTLRTRVRADAAVSPTLSMLVQAGNSSDTAQTRVVDQYYYADYRDGRYRNDSYAYNYYAPATTTYRYDRPSTRTRDYNYYNDPYFVAPTSTYYNYQYDYYSMPNYGSRYNYSSQYYYPMYREREPWHGGNYYGNYNRNYYTPAYYCDPSRFRCDE